MSAGYNTGYSSFTENDEVGRVRSPKFQLPPSTFTYGKALDRDPEGAGQVIRSWALPSPSRAPPKHRDFKTLNKVSLRNGFHEARGIREFRKNVSAFETPKVGSKTIKIVLPEEEFIYGVANRPSTPMTSVMNNEYGMRAALLTQEMYKTHFEESKIRNLSLPKLNNTTRVSHEKVSKRLSELNNAEQKPLFKLKKFLVTSPKVECINKTYIPASSTRAPANGETSKKL